MDYDEDIKEGPDVPIIAVAAIADTRAASLDRNATQLGFWIGRSINQFVNFSVFD